MIKEERFYDQANNTYTIGSYKVIADAMTGEHAGLHMLLFLVFSPILLFVWLLNWRSKSNDNDNTAYSLDHDDSVN